MHAGAGAAAFAMQWGIAAHGRIKEGIPMKSIRAGWALATVAAALAAPALAQTSTVITNTSVQSSTGIPVTSANGILVTPGVPISPQTLMAGAVMSPGSTQVLGAGPDGTTTVTTYWVNVPPNVESNSTFQRWRSLK